MRSRFILIGMGAVLLLMLSGAAAFLYIPQTINADMIYISDCEVSEDSITLQGGFADSARKFRGYNLSYDNGTLYIQMQGSLLSLSDSHGEFNLSIPNRYEGIRQIYIQGADSPLDRALAWTYTS